LGGPGEVELRIDWGKDEVISVNQDKKQMITQTKGDTIKEEKNPA
jgi:hypothetical protein